VDSFNQFFKKELNHQQQQAVAQKDGATLVIAGAGSGKTRVITARIAHLILNENKNPNSIIALTFTNKAANEMKERVSFFLKEKYSLPFVGTFHSYCLLLLKTNPQMLPYSSFSIIDAEDQQSLIKKILKKYNLEKQFSAAQLQYQISYFKNKLLTNSENEFVQPIFKEIFLEYESEKSKSHSLDFDDLILQVLKVLQKDKTIKNLFQQKVRNILVDEYQDTNAAQHELLKNMILDSNKKFTIDSLCAVGDEDQSIYSWRGAMVTNMLKFQDDFAPVTKIKIEQNYRSVDPILKAANEVISKNKTHFPKNLWSKKKASNRILAITCKSDYQESDVITTIVKNLPENKKFNECSIIYRTHFQSRIIEESFIRNSIPYNIIGGIRFYERREIKDLLAYLRLVVNPFDKTSLFRIINCPTRGLGAKFEEQLFLAWHQNNLLNFQQILEQISSILPTLKAQSIKNFLNIFENLDKNQKTSIVIDQVLERTDYKKFLKKTYEPNEADSKIENISELLHSIDFFEAHPKEKGNQNLENFLHEVALLQEKIKNDEKKEDQVQMMSMHAAKGLEFDTVIICGLEEGILPGSKSLASLQLLEEERRLFYVGMTRAKERLILTYANYRNNFGQICDQVVSRFLTEVPSKLVRYVDISQSHPIQTQSLISKWLGKKTQNTLLTFNDFLKQKTKTTRTKSFKASTTTSWHKNQTVIHPKFGTGLIKKVEQKNKDEYYLTVLFKAGEKRLLSSFLKQI